MLNRRWIGIYLYWYLPAWLPFGLIVIEWIVLAIADKPSLATAMVDVPFTAFTFDIWAITTKAEGQPLRSGWKLVDKLDDKGEWALIIGSLIIHLIVYLFAIWAWLVAPTVWGQLLAGVAMTVGGLLPLLLLGRPVER